MLRRASALLLLATMAAACMRSAGPAVPAHPIRDEKEAPSEDTMGAVPDDGGSVTSFDDASSFEEEELFDDESSAGGSEEVVVEEEEEEIEEDDL
jgi:hypothetical protein